MMAGPAFQADLAQAKAVCPEPNIDPPARGTQAGLRIRLSPR